MKSYRIGIGLAVLVMVLISGVLYADVFHGRDKETGTMISRASVKTSTPDEALAIGLQIIRIHDGNKVTVAFTSLDKALKELDTSSAALLVDGQKISLPFKRYSAFTIHEILPPVHQLWFAELEQSSVAQIAKCKNMSITISTVSGIPLKRSLGAVALSDVKEVLSSIQDIRHETCVKKLDNDSENIAKYQYPDEIDSENTFSTANDIDKVEDKAIIKLKAIYQSRFEHDIADGETRFFNTDDIQFGSFLRRFETAVYGVWRYPAEAAKMGIYGITPVKITFNRRGEIIGAELLQSSGSKILDNEVLRTLKMIGPVGSFPKGYDKDTFNLIAFFHYGNSHGAMRSLR